MSIDEVIRGDPMIKKYLLLADIHYPEHDKKTMKAVESFMGDFKPDEIVYLGDALDMSPVSHWMKDKKRPMEGQRLIKDYKGFNEMLQKHADVSKCKSMTYHMGNHEQWVEQYVDVNPELEGFLEVENNLEFPVKAQYIEFNDFQKIGKLYATHGLYTNTHHAKKMIDVMGKSVVYGHVHDIQSYSKVSPLTDERHKAQSLGCMCKMNPGYMKNKPNNWSNGFGIVFVNTKTGQFNLQSIEVIKGKFMYNGKLYK